ncbi:serine/arginine-rich splicing factor 7-like isoform X6 [Ptychodera flava]
MSHYRSYSRSRSRSRSRSPRRDHHGSRSRRSSRRSHSPDWDADGTRVYCGDLGIDCSRREIEKAFSKYGKLGEVWVARNPPCFAFIVFLKREDAEEAIRDMDGRMLCGGRVRVSLARPRTRGRGRRGYDPNLRCYQCGERGHFSRDCRYYSRSYRQGPQRSRSRRSRTRSRSRSRSRSPERKQSHRKSYSRDRSVSRSKSRSRSRSRASRDGGGSPVQEKRSRSRSVRSSSKSPRKRRSESGSPVRDASSPQRRFAEIEKSALIIDSA